MIVGGGKGIIMGGKYFFRSILFAGTDRSSR